MNPDPETSVKKSVVLANLNGSVGLLAIWQMLFAAAIIFEQLFWTVCPPVILYRSESSLFQRAAIFDYEKTLILLLSTVLAIGSLFWERDSVTRRPLAFMACLFVGLYWVCLMDVLVEPSFFHRFTARSPAMDTGAYSLSPRDITELQIRFCGDPMAHASFWAGVGQVLLCIALFRPSLQKRRICLLDIAIFIAAISLALAIGSFVQSPTAEDENFMRHSARHPDEITRPDMVLCDRRSDKLSAKI